METAQRLRALGCSSRESRSHSQPPGGVPQLSVTPVLGALMPSSGLHGHQAPRWCRYACKQNTCTHEIEITKLENKASEYKTMVLVILKKNVIYLILNTWGWLWPLILTCLLTPVSTGDWCGIWSSNDANISILSFPVKLFIHKAACLKNAGISPLGNRAWHQS